MRDRRGWLQGLVVPAVLLTFIRWPEPTPVAAPPVDVIFDTDMALDVDDLGALALLHALADRGECRILAVGVSESSRAYDGLWAPVLADVVNTFYGRPDIPVGVYRGPHQDLGEKGRYAEKTAKAFPHDLRSGADAPEAFRLYRRVLAGRPDASVVMASVGFLTNLEALLRSGPDEWSPLSGVELVRRKVRAWSCMGGEYPASRGDGEFNFAIYPQATAYVLERWPSPATFSGFELGAQVKTGARLIRERDASANPVARAYGEYTGGADRESWDQTAALYAVRGLGHGARAYFTAVTGGRNRFELLPGPRAGPGSPQLSRNTWVADPDRGHAYLKAAMPAAELARVIEDLMMHQPASRSSR